MKRLAHILIIISIVMVAACSGGVHGDLMRADRLMSSRPDSALKVLQSIDSVTISNVSRADRAWHALLLSKANAKNYLDLDTNLIASAVEYYRGRGDSLEAQGLYYYAYSLAEAGRNERALVGYMQAYYVANQAADSFFMAMAAREQAAVYARLFSYQKAADMCGLAADLFDKCNKPIHSTWEQVDRSNYLSRVGQSALAYHILDSLNDNDLIRDSKALHRNWLMTYAHVCSDDFDYPRTIALFDSMRAENYKMYSGSWGRLSLAHYYMGNLYQAEICLDSTLKTAENIDDSLLVGFIVARIERDNGNGNKAFDMLREYDKQQMLRNNYLIAHPYINLLTDYYQALNQETTSRLAKSRYRIYLWSTIAIFMLVVICFIIIYYRKKVKVNDLKIRCLMSDLESYKLTSDNDRRQIADLLKEHIIKTMGSSQGIGNSTKSSIAKLNGLNSPDMMNQVEILVDKYYNNIITRFRTENPDFGKLQLNFVTLSVAQLSSNAIAILLGKNVQSIYTLRCRIKDILKDRHSELNDYIYNIL